MYHSFSVTVYRKVSTTLIGFLHLVGIIYERHQIKKKTLDLPWGDSFGSINRFTVKRRLQIDNDNHVVYFIRHPAQRLPKWKTDVLCIFTFSSEIQPIFRELGCQMKLKEEPV